MSLKQGEFETITKFKERFDNKLKAYNATLDPTAKVSEPRAAMAFLSKLNKLQYGQFYAHMINIINADPNAIPSTVNEVYQKAKASRPYSSNWYLLQYQTRFASQYISTYAK